MSWFSYGRHSTPKRNSSRILSPFGISTSQLEEVTMASDVTFTNSIRASNAVMGGRCVKEFEEQLDGLKKENFNLKLRIYFLEERMGGNWDLNKETAIKKNVELKVEVESLKKELEEKHDLLCQAVKAMELEEDEHKKLMEQKNEEITTLKNDLIDVKLKLDNKEVMKLRQSEEFLASSHSLSSPDTSIINVLQENVATLEKELALQKEVDSSTRNLLNQKEAEIQTLKNDLKIVEQKRSEAKEYGEQCEKKLQSYAEELNAKSELIENLSSENMKISQRYTQLKTVYENESKRYEKLKSDSETKINELETHLEECMGELRKSQEVVVASNPITSQSNVTTDTDSISVQKPSTSHRSVKASITSIQPQTLDGTPTLPTSPSSSNTYASNLNCFDVYLTVMKSTNMRKWLSDLRLDYIEQQKKIQKLSAEQTKACKIIKTLVNSKSNHREEIMQLTTNINELKNKLAMAEKRGNLATKTNHSLTTTIVNQCRSIINSETPSNDAKENSMTEECGDGLTLLEHYKVLTKELETKNEILMETVQEQTNQISHLREQQDDLKRRLQEKDHRIVDLEFDLFSRTTNTMQHRTPPSNHSLTEKSDADTEKTYTNYEILREKDEEIAVLNEKLAKRNNDLQALVNNELWEKNREIERLEKQQKDKNIEMDRIKRDLAEKESQLNLLKRRIAEVGVSQIEEIDGAGCGAIDADQMLLDRLRTEIDRLKAEVDKQQISRNELNELCTLLSARLEELAMFLDSLLKNKLVLGFLGTKENKKLREIIDQSLDLSRSFTMNMLINPAEQSLTQLSNITSLLNTTDDLTYHSHLNVENDSQVIAVLRQQVTDLRQELHLRDVEYNKLTVRAHSPSNSDANRQHRYECENQSESEAWSEPDRSVSKARIGLVDESLRRTSQKCDASESTTEDEEGGNRSFTKRSGLSENRQTIIDLHKEICLMEGRLMDSEKACKETSDLLEKEREINKQLDGRLKELQMKTDAFEKKSVEAEENVLNLQKIVANFENEQQILKENLQLKDKNLHNTLNEFEKEKGKLQKNIDEYVAKLQELQQEKDELETKLRAEYEAQALEKLKGAEQAFLERIEQIESKARIEIKMLRDDMDAIQKEYETNYVKKVEAERLTEELQRKTALLDDLQNRLQQEDVERKQSQQIVSDLKNDLIKQQERYNLLRDDLDQLRLQYAEAVLNKTNIASELTQIRDQKCKLKLQMKDIQKELHDLIQNHNRHNANAQMERAKLEVRLSELESINAELHNRLIRMQATPSTTTASVSFRPDHSGYTSEDNRHGPQQIEEDQARRDANSSPDLGIESDQGRFSSFEAHISVARPLLQTLELTESMNNLLDLERSQGDNCGNEHCCKKTLEMAHENTDLKRKLLRTKRALEDALTQISLANQRKKQVEKTICKQIHKTSQVLKKAKANLDSGSESDLLRKT